MDKKDMLYYFLSSAKSSEKRLKVSGGEPGVVKGYVRDLVKDGDLLTVTIEDAVYVIDLKNCEVKTSLFDHRVIHVNGDEPLKFQLW